MTATVDEGNSTTWISRVHPDILRAHILTRLDGPTLVSTRGVSSELNSLASEEALWSKICLSTWPSTTSPRVREVISTFPNGFRSFFSSSFPLLSSSSPAKNNNYINNNNNTNNKCSDRKLPSELISAVDIYYKKGVLFSKVVETETVSGWFRCSPFRIDMLDPKDSTCPTPIPYRPDDSDQACRELAEELTLSWILIDPVGKRAVNLSSHKPVSVQRHWLSGEVHAQFATVLRARKGVVQCMILVTCVSKARGDEVILQVREVSLQLEDLDGMFMKGKECLGILHGAFEGKRGIKVREGREGRRRYEEFLEMKRNKKEMKLRMEGTLDMLSLAFGLIIFASLVLFLLLR